MSTHQPAVQGTDGRTSARRSDTESVLLSVVGSGGDGVGLLGDLLMAVAARQGIYGMMLQSYGPQIRGGESAAMLRFSRSEVLYEGESSDLLLCFRMNDLLRFRGTLRLHADSVMIVEASDPTPAPEWLGQTAAEPYRYPFASMKDGMEVPGDPKNMLGLALLCRSLGWPGELAREVIRERFGKRQDVLVRNLEAFDRAWPMKEVPRLPVIEGTGRALTIESGNEAVARGAMDAGMRFFAGYPITPSTEIMETLIKELPARGGSVVQSEDEMSALGMVIGASFGGVPAMTATSGPGFSLMTEMMGLSCMAELPAVVVDCQRAGPATGMPSRTEQADLNHALYGGHGDLPRAVLGILDVVQAREAMAQAFTLSETYQLPVVVLSDAYIAQRRQIHDPAPPPPAATPKRAAWSDGQGVARFDLHTTDGVAPFRIPGTPGGTYLAGGIEHTELGAPTADTQIHIQMSAKRQRKLEAIADQTRDWFCTLGRPEATRGLIAWGSMYGLLREWVADNPDYRVFVPKILLPFPVHALERWRRNLEWTGVMELSHTGQFLRYLSTLADTRGIHGLTRAGGTPLSRAELTRMLKEATK